MKTVKFRDYLVPMVLSGEKNSTWRLFDDKDLQVGDDIELQVFVTNQPFARATISNVIEKRFADLTEDDKRGHGTYETDAEMYADFTKFYKVAVDPNTMVKIIWFELQPASPTIE